MAGAECSKKNIGVISLLLVAATCFTYWPVTRAEFVNYDDPFYILINPKIQSGISLSGLRWALTSGYADNWHPLTWVSHMVDIEIFGLTPGGPHLTNLSLHIANSLL